MSQQSLPTPQRYAVDGQRKWRRSLRWFLAEFVVLVAGILVALAVSSWAQDRQDAKREQVYLRQLEVDLVANEKDLAAMVEELAGRTYATSRVLHRF